MVVMLLDWMYVTMVALNKLDISIKTRNKEVKTLLWWLVTGHWHNRP